MLNQSNLDALIKASRRSGPRSAEDKSKSVQTCDFRLAGKLSNENARILSANQETLGRQLSDALLDFLGSDWNSNPMGWSRFRSRNTWPPSLPSATWFPISHFHLCVAVLEFDLNIVFPIIERLLGGLDGASASDSGTFRDRGRGHQDVAL